MTDPLAALLDLAREQLAFKDALRAMVDELDGAWTYWTDGRGHETEDVPIRTESVENLRATITTYERALDRCGKILADLTRLGIDERMVRLREAQALAVIAAVRSALDGAADAGELTRTGAAAISSRVATELRAAG